MEQMTKNYLISLALKWYKAPGFIHCYPRHLFEVRRDHIGIWNLFPQGAGGGGGGKEGREGKLPYEKIGDCRQKNWIKPPKETNLSDHCKQKRLDYRTLFRKGARVLRLNSRDRRKSSLKTEITAGFCILSKDTLTAKNSGVSSWTHKVRPESLIYTPKLFIWKSPPPRVYLPFGKPMPYLT